MIAPGDRHRCVDHIGAVGDTAELTGGPGLPVVKNQHFAQRSSEEPGQPGLVAAVPPGLSDHPGGHQERVVMLEGAGDNGHDSSIVPFEPDERSGVEDGRAQRPSARSAA